MGRARVDRRLLERAARKGRQNIPGAIDRLVRLAKQSCGECVRVDAAGWSFMLSIGLFDEERRRADPSLNARATRALFGKDVEATCDGRCGVDHEHWHFSARPQPAPRSTCDEDWRNLGYATSLVGVPEEVSDKAKEQIEDDAWVDAHPIHYPWVVPLEARAAPSDVGN